MGYIVSDIAIFVLKRDVKLQLTHLGYTHWEISEYLTFFLIYMIRIQRMTFLTYPQ